MKNILIFSAILMVFAGSKICGCGNSCSTATAQSTKVSPNKKEDLKTIKLKVTGMTCTGCSNHISGALKKVDGILEHKVEYPGDWAIIVYDPRKTNPEAIIKVIEKSGYKAAIITEIKNRKVA